MEVVDLVLHLVQVELAGQKRRLFFVKLLVPHHRLFDDSLFPVATGVVTLLVVNYHKVNRLQVLICLSFVADTQLVQVSITRNVAYLKALVICIV